MTSCLSVGLGRVSRSSRGSSPKRLPLLSTPNGFGNGEIMAFMTAGEHLRTQYEEALQRASRETGRQLEWTESESVALEKAVESADRAEQMRALLDFELARPEPRAPLGPAIVGRRLPRAPRAPSSPNTNSSRHPSALGVTAGDPKRFGPPVGYDRQLDHSLSPAVCDWW